MRGPRKLFNAFLGSFCVGVLIGLTIFDYTQIYHRLSINSLVKSKMSNRKLPQAKEDAESYIPDDIQYTLYNSVRLLCWVVTTPKTLYKRAVHIKHTWGPRCNVLLFVSDVYDPMFPTINITVNEGYDFLMVKTTKALEYIYKHHTNDADWFIKADDDTLIIPENLRYMLSLYNSSKALYFGQHFKIAGVNLEYCSGGAGYVLSKEALTRFALRKQHVYEQRGRCVDYRGAEDAELGSCVRALGAKLEDSRDSLGRTRFHSMPPKTIMFNEYPDWLYQYDQYGAKSGAESISNIAVTFHYLRPDEMHLIHLILYHLKVKGEETDAMHLNTPPIDSANLTNTGINSTDKRLVENIAEVCPAITLPSGMIVYTC